MTETTAKRILVVDDASLVRMFYRTALEQAGFVVEEARNGVEAMEKLLGAPVDMMVVDVNMPQMDGVTFLQTLRRRQLPLSATPALVITTESAPQDLAAARAAGANFFLVKPVTPEQLVSYALAINGLPHG
jgi:two-component system chemotaxis response regulator CheY